MGKQKSKHLRWQTQKSTSVSARERMQQHVTALEDLKIKHERMLILNPTSYSFDMSKGDDEKLRLSQVCWQGEFKGCLSELLVDNPELTAMLRAAVSNTYSPDDEDLFLHKQDLKLESLLSTIYKSQNQQQMPLFIVLRSIYSYHHGMHRESWNFESAVKLLASHRWTEEFIKFSICHNPGPPFEALPFVSGVVFDNFTVKVDYKSLHDLDHNGYRLDMTNWGSVTIPQEVNLKLNIAAIIAGKYE